MLILALILLVVFTANVVIGATSGTPVIGVVGEMLVLLAASVCFVAAVLRKEADAKAAAKTE